MVTGQDNYAKIIGNPLKIEYIEVQQDSQHAANLEVAQYDFPNPMNWDSAKKICGTLGKGWRLPTKDELKTLFQNREKIGGFEERGYWSSTEGASYGAWYQFFYDGSQDTNIKEASHLVRAIRAF
jgi:hypothetical protein